MKLQIRFHAVISRSHVWRILREVYIYTVSSEGFDENAHQCRLYKIYVAQLSEVPKTSCTGSYIALNCGAQRLSWWRVRLARLTGIIVLCPCERHFIRFLVIVPTRLKNVGWDVKHHHKYNEFSRWMIRGGSRISEKGVHVYKYVGFRKADFISFFLNIPWNWNNLVSLRPNYFIFIGFLKTGARGGGGGGGGGGVLSFFLHT